MHWPSQWHTNFSMLYLLQDFGSAADSQLEPVPVAELTAVGLERALLAADRATRERELAATFIRDPGVTAWAIHAARQNCENLVTTMEEAIAWLAGCLEAQLAATLAPDHEHTGTVGSDIETRLPALVSRLADYERRLADFNARLEHEKLESIKELAYGASHEINNPLANIAVRAQTLLQEESDPERGRKLAAIHRQAMRAHEMIADLMLFARPPKLDCQPVDVRSIAHQVADEMAEMAAEQDTGLTCEVGDLPIETVADSTQLAVAIRALAANALEATGEGGHIRIGVRQSEIEDETWAEISVRDDGPGISDDVRQHMFDPFFSGREAGRGLGFGLPKCWRIVTDHGGRIIVQRPSAGGAEISILLKTRTNFHTTAVGEG
jgi:signal transduction histidine kinase